MKTKKAKIELADKIEASKKIIATERDKLRALLSDVEDVCLDCDDAVGDMERVVEALSRNL